MLKDSPLNDLSFMHAIVEVASVIESGLSLPLRLPLRPPENEEMHGLPTVSLSATKDADAVMLVTQRVFDPI